MEAYIIDILSLAIKWLHIIVGIAWIGTSFYFVMLDNSLLPPVKTTDKERGALGELWAVHGGGIYCSQKFPLGPKGETLSKNLHWSKWEAYSTWLSGLGLLIIIYWYQAQIYLINPSVMPLNKPVAIITSMAFLIGGWLIYDSLCKFIRGSDITIGIIIFILASLAAWALCQLYSGRGAYIIFGSMLGTIMVANVFFVIIPNQKKMISSIISGDIVNPKLAQTGKTRSLHNTYFTLPVIFTMFSNHYAVTYGNEYNWAILIALSFAGALIRVFFISYHNDKPSYSTLAIAIIPLVAVFIIAYPRPNINETLKNTEFTTIKTIIQTRCSACHSATPSQAGFNAPPKNIIYDTDIQIISQAANIYQQAVATKVMPIGNITKITLAERQILGSWAQKLINEKTNLKQH